MHAYIHTYTLCVNTYMYTRLRCRRKWFACSFGVCTHTYILLVCVCVCIYICICTYVYIYTYKHMYQAWAAAEGNLHAILARDGARVIFPTRTHTDMFFNLLGFIAEQVCYVRVYLHTAVSTYVCVYVYEFLRSLLRRFVSFWWDP